MSKNQRDSEDSIGAGDGIERDKRKRKAKDSNEMAKNILWLPIRNHSRTFDSRSESLPLIHR
jgi:hypothetical protein